jgi:hypothetical protein
LNTPGNLSDDAYQHAVRQEQYIIIKITTTPAMNLSVSGIVSCMRIISWYSASIKAATGTCPDGLRAADRDEDNVALLERQLVISLQRG